MSWGHCVCFFPVWQMMIIPVRQSDFFSGASFILKYVHCCIVGRLSILTRGKSTQKKSESCMKKHKFLLMKMNPNSSQSEY